MTMQAQNTPAELLRLIDDSLICCDQDGLSDHFCQIPYRVKPGERAANAKFIFDACRAYESDKATIVSLTAALEHVREVGEEYKDTTSGLVKCWEIACEALAQAWKE